MLRDAERKFGGYGPYQSYWPRSGESSRPRCEHERMFVRGWVWAGNLGNPYRRPIQACLQCGWYGHIRRGDAASVWDLQLSTRSASDLPSRFAGTGGFAVCARCERSEPDVALHEHHWAPSAIFRDASYWPRSILCDECHGFWHAQIRQAKGYRLDRSDRQACPADAERFEGEGWRWLPFGGGFVSIAEECFAHYGKQCVCCGRFQQLEIDHVIPQARSFAKKISGTSLYYRLRREGFPPGFQTLCRSCNASKNTGTWCLIHGKYLGPNPVRLDLSADKLHLILEHTGLPPIPMLELLPTFVSWLEIMTKMGVLSTKLGGLEMLQTLIDAKQQPSPE
jgi:5-methylcytosine-specific restriction endonuclease McrA